MMVAGLGNGVSRLLFAQRLQRAVELRRRCASSRSSRPSGRRPCRGERGGLVGRRVVGRIDRDGRDEDVLPDLARQHPTGVAHPDRQRGRVVDADIPVAALQRLQVGGVAVAEQLLDRARPGALLLAAVEDGHLVPARQRVADFVRPDKTGAAQDQKLQFPHRWLGGRAGEPARKDESRRRGRRRRDDVSPGRARNWGHVRLSAHAFPPPPGV